MEVQAGHFHSNPIYTGHHHLENGSFDYFPPLLLEACSCSVTNAWMSLATNADRVPASCCHAAHGHPPQGLHCPGLLFRGEASMTQLTMTVEVKKKEHKHTALIPVKDKSCDCSVYLPSPQVYTAPEALRSTACSALSARLLAFRCGDKER